MESCAAETGLLKKKPCGQAAVAKCANCEMPLCSKHAVAQVSASKQRTGKFMCAECDRAQREHEKLAPPARPTAAPARAAQPALKPSAPAAKPAAPAAKPAATPAPMPKDSPAPQPSGKKELSLEDSQPLEFTPSKKPEEKK